MARSCVSRTSIVIGALLGAMLAFGGLALPESGAEPMTGEGASAPNELLVKFSEQMSASEIEDVNESLGVEVVNRMFSGRLLLVRFPHSKSFEDVRATYEATPGVEYAEPSGSAAPPIVTIAGVLTDEGVECPALRADDGGLYTLTGDLQGFAAGDRVRVTGTVAEISFCMQGTTLTVDRIEEG